MDSGDVYTVDMTPEDAFQASKSGGTILMLDVPPGTTVGVDHRSFSTGSKFLGVKMLPPGVHLISTSSTDGTGRFAPVTGFFIWLASGQIEVWRWDREEEMLSKLSDEEASCYKQGVMEFSFDDGLAPYDLRRWKQWRELSKFIGREVIEDIMPVSGYISIMDEGIDMGVTEATAAERELLDQLGQVRSQEGMKDGLERGKPGNTCFYTDIPLQRGLVGSELTAVHMDKSPVLEDLLVSHFSGNGDRMLGELQFAFLSFMICQSLQGLKQWKSLLNLMLGCEQAFLDTHTKVFVSFVNLLKSQLQVSFQEDVDEGNGICSSVWTDSVLEESFLKNCLLQFLGRVFEAAEEGSGVDAELYERCQAISQLMSSKLGWQVEDGETGEYAPVIVEV